MEIQSRWRSSHNWKKCWIPVRYFITVLVVNSSRTLAIWIWELDEACTWSYNWDSNPTCCRINHHNFSKKLLSEGFNERAMVERCDDFCNFGGFNIAAVFRLDALNVSSLGFGNISSGAFFKSGLTSVTLSRYDGLRPPGIDCCLMVNGNGLPGTSLRKLEADDDASNRGAGKPDDSDAMSNWWTDLGRCEIAGPNETALGFALDVNELLFGAFLRSSMISHDSSRLSLCMTVEIPPTYSCDGPNTNDGRDWPFHDCKLGYTNGNSDHNGHVELLADANC